MLRPLRKTVKWTLILLISACILVFTANNFQAVDISLFPLSYEISVPLFLLVLACFSLGVITGGLLLSVQSFRWRRQAKAARQRSEALENEIRAGKMERAALPVAAQG